ncbi:MAG TPA: 3-oxoacyl-[acyl-carrier-protein] reductase [Firmicutes bacterium]|nr:3-oxoacyl-[acyl-carrier-protein] reductase [Bacillota bacterium]
MELAGRVAVVTGGSKGIGRAICLALAAKGARVVVLGNTDLSGAEAVADEIVRQGGESFALKTDVTDLSDVENMVEVVLKRFGSIDILVNNAGITRDNFLIRMKDEEWEEVIDVNLRGAFNCIRAVGKVMFRQRSGRIINITSVVGLTGNPGQANYSSSKAGLIGLTKTAARELAMRGITVNAVAPGFIETRMTDAIPENARDALLKAIPLGRMGKPEDVAKAVTFLASDDASYITGVVLRVDGGMAM